MSHKLMEAIQQRKKNPFGVWDTPLSCHLIHKSDSLSTLNPHPSQVP